MFLFFRNIEEMKEKVVFRNKLLLMIKNKHEILIINTLIRSTRTQTSRSEEKL